MNIDKQATLFAISVTFLIFSFVAILCYYFVPILLPIVVGGGIGSILLGLIKGIK